MKKAVSGIYTNLPARGTLPNWPKRKRTMNKITNTTLPSIELEIIEAYISDNSDCEFSNYYDLYDIDEHDFISKLQIAVACILLKPIEKNLPQRFMYLDGKTVKGRKKN
jgi:hypothetical protein